ncbi:MAG: 2,3-bisphosphoglycerate-independent phosphoglycerate mutase [Alphaproteobacteria bacterium]|nr:2,3-bisphosphoglycerate-independent phosphoglycerate mutase [Alphaproteobacteria bacterium]
MSDASTSSLRLSPLPHGLRGRPVVLCILDGVGLGRRDDGDAVARANTPCLDRLLAERPHCALAAHGTAVGLPGDGDMGNSEVGHNALGSGRVFQQGASLVDAALASGSAFGETWRWLTAEGTLHLIGLLSDGNVHSHAAHLHALIRRAAADGVARVRVHVLTDGRDVEERSALRYLEPLEALLIELSEDGRDYRVASGGGRMRITMDRYEADWGMVQRGWDCHVRGQGRPFPSASEAVRALYDADPKVNDQWLPAFVIVDEAGAPVGPIRDGDGVLLFNFRGDRAIELSKALEGRDVPIDRGDAPAVRFAGMMQYDGDEQVPRRFLVDPPAIDRTVGRYLAANGRTTFAVSETQKYGHVTYFFNGNRSGYLDPERERYVCVPSRDQPFEQIPEMEAAAVTDAAIEAIRSGDWDHVRLNLANGDMVGHTGDFDATVRAMEVVDACVARLVTATEAAGGVLLVTADHGNADDMVQRDKKTGAIRRGTSGAPVPRTSHSLNPVPFVLVDPSGRWVLDPPADPGLANVGATLLTLCGLTPPADYRPSLVRPREDR